MLKLYCRLYQGIFRLVHPVLPWRQPELIEGKDSIKRLPGFMKEKGIGKVLVVTDKGIVSLGLMDSLLKGFNDEGVEYVIYDQTVPNPTIDNIEEALQIYKANHCEGIVAFGGGSSMDCAKGVGARVARPEKSIPQMKGVLKVRKKLPPLFAIPTTAGTGSETTVAAIITNSKTHEKYAVNDMALTPHYAVLDPMLTVGLPPHITSTTGMDALTHAVEAYIGQSNTRETEKQAKDAVKIIFDNIFKVYTDGNDLEARANMQKAAYYAGAAFTQAYVGYIHAVAHTLGGFYGVPHGLANAVILPYVLELYEESIHQRLAELADVAGIVPSSDSVQQKAAKFIEAIKKLNRDMDIPDKITGILDQDIPLMAQRAHQEANPLYPVPKIMNKEELADIYRMIRA